MADVFFGVKTQSNKYLAIPAEWVQKKDEKMSKIFYSPNLREQPDFTKPTRYFVDNKTAACYNAYIIREIGKGFHIHILIFYLKR